MSERSDSTDSDELRAMLHGVDPASSLPPADPARVADLLEDAVSTTRPTPAAAPAAGETDVSGRGGLSGRRGRIRPGGPDGSRGPDRSRRRWPLVIWLAAAAAAVVLAAVAVPVFRSLAPEPVTTTLTAEAFDPATASCFGVAENLTHVDTAFAGRVTSVDGDRVVLDVERVYLGEPGDRVEVDAPQQDEMSTALIGGFPFEPGGEYLVAARDGVVWACGASGPTTGALQAEYERAFGG